MPCDNNFQEEFDDEDDWNPCKAAGVCLSLMAGCCEDAIVAPIIAFVNQHLKNTDWKFRDAAVMALGTWVGEGGGIAHLLFPQARVWRVQIPTSSRPT